MNIHQFNSGFLVKSLFHGAPTNGSQTGPGIDCLGFRRLAVLCDLITGAATTIQVQIDESDDNSTWGAVIAASSIPAVAQVAATNGGTNNGVPYVLDVDLSKRKRYIQVTVVGTGTAGNAQVTGVLFNPENQAVTQDQTAISI